VDAVIAMLEEADVNSIAFVVSTVSEFASTSNVLVASISIEVADIDAVPESILMYSVSDVAKLTYPWRETTASP